MQASIAANTYVVSGASQPKRAQDVMASMLAGMGGMAGLQQMMGGMGGMPAFNPEGAADEPEDDDDGAPAGGAVGACGVGRLWGGSLCRVEGREVADCCG